MQNRRGFHLATAVGLLAITLSCWGFVGAASASATLAGADCSGSCIFSNGRCRDVDCTGTNCGCSGGRNDCACGATSMAVKPISYH